VAWIQERKNVLSGFFFFATILAYLRFASIGPARQPQPVSPAGQQKHAPLWYFLALALTACALLSKTAVCGLPAVLALLLWWKRDHLSRRDWLRLLPFFALAFLLGSVTVWVEKNFVGAQGDEWNFSILERCLLAGRVLWFYPAKLVWPVNLSFIYPRWQLDSAAWPQYLYPLAAIAVVTSLWLLRGRLGKGPVVAVLYFAGMLAPTLGFINYYPMRFSFVADHFVYVPSAGLLALAAALVTRALSRLPSRSPLRPTLAAALPLVLLSLTWKHGQYFTDEVALWKNTLAKNPDCWLAHSTLAGIMNRKNEDRAAIEHAEAALRLNRDEVYAHYNLGVVLERNNALELAEKHLREAARLAPDSCPALLHLGGIRLKQGRLEEAAGYLVEEATMKPWSISALLMLAETRARQQDWHEACACLRKVCELAPRTPDYHTALANALDKIGAHTEAEAHRREARQIEN
jgi:tetratricopeptide (TPR) repeat protein